MKARPILFTGEMVRALLGGRKTQTRRVVTARNSTRDGHPRGWNFFPFAEHDWAAAVVDAGPSPAGNAAPYLKVPFPVEETVHRVYPVMQEGDRLWVKENFFPVHTVRHEPKFAASTVDFIYQADYQNPDRIIAPHHWRPSIFCGHKATRITLEITAVRVERLQAISEEDARAEGVECTLQYKHLWEKINGLGSWAANPWVWVVEFRKI